MLLPTAGIEPGIASIASKRIIYYSIASQPLVILKYRPQKVGVLSKDLSDDLLRVYGKRKGHHALVRDKHNLVPKKLIRSKSGLCLAGLSVRIIKGVL